MNEKQFEELIPTHQAAHLLGLKTVAFSKWMNGHIPSKGPFEIKPALQIGGAYLWNRKEVEAFAAKLVGGYRKRNPTPFPDDYYDDNE